MHLNDGATVAQARSEAKPVWCGQKLNKYLRTCGQKMWNRHSSRAVQEWQQPTTKNGNFQSKQTKAKSNQSEPSRGERVKVKINLSIEQLKWARKDYTCDQDAPPLLCISRACLYKSKYFRKHRKQICFESRAAKGFPYPPNRVLCWRFALQFAAFAISCAN